MARIPLSEWFVSNGGPTRTPERAAILITGYISAHPVPYTEIEKMVKETCPADEEMILQWVPSKLAELVIRLNEEAESLREKARKIYEVYYST